MATWAEVAAEAPELARAARAMLDAYRHKTLATLRRDGSPRISGIEVEIIDGDLWFGGLWQSLKMLDLRRDPRFALHSGTGDAASETWAGDAKLAGRAEEITDPERIAAIHAATPNQPPPGPMHLFRADVTELVVTRPGEPPDHLLIEVWRQGEGVRRIERR
jgi:hypothetical protein